MPLENRKMVFTLRATFRLFLVVFLSATVVFGGLVFLGAFASSSTVDSAGSWNPKVNCNSPMIVRVSDITDNMTGSNSYNNSPFSPGITESVSGSQGAKRWLTPGATPPGWHSPGPSCTITDLKGQTVASFVEIDGVGTAFPNYVDCTTSFDPVNGGSAMPSGHWCDNGFNIFDPAPVASYSTSCTSSTDPTCYGRMHVEFDRDWMAAGYCGLSSSTCNNSTLRSQMNPGSSSTLFDFQGFIFWDSGHTTEQWHSFSGWELHPLTAWRPHKSSTNPLSAGFVYSPASPNPGQTITFTASASGGVPPYSYSWSFGDGSSGTGSSATHSYTSAGSFTVGLTVKDSGSPQQTALSQKTVTVQTSTAKLIASFSYNPSSPQAGQPVSFTGSASGGMSPYGYSWSFGDGSTGSGSSVAHTYSSAGAFTVVLTVKDSSSPQQTVTSQRAVSTTSPPSLTASFSFSPTSPLAGQAITFTSSVSGGISPYMFSWSFGDGSSGTGSSITHAYPLTGSYTVTLTVKDSGSPQQTTTSRQAVSVSSPPPLSANFNASPASPDAGQSVSFTASVSGGTSPYSYSWDFGDSGTTSGGSVNHTFSSGGNFTVALTVTDSGGRVAKSSKTITVNPQLSGSFTYSPSNPLPLTTVTFRAGASGGAQSYSYSWDFGDGSTGSGQSASHSYLLPGSYTVTLTVTDANRQSFSTSQTIMVLASI